MKILHVIDSCDPKIGGPIEGIKQLNFFYKKNKMTANLLCSNDKLDIKKFKKNLPKIYAMGSGLGKYSYNNNMFIWLKQNIDKYSVVIVHGIWQYHNYAVWKITKEKGIPYFVLPHGSLDPWFNRKYPIKFIKKYIYWNIFQHKILADSNGVLFTNKIELALAKNSFDLTKIKKINIGYGISGNPYKKIALKKKKKLKKKIFAYIGRIHEKKGLDILIKSFLNILKFTSEYHLVIAGPKDTKYFKYLNSLIPKKLKSNISWPGALFNKKKWNLFNSCYVFCMPSHQENFGISIAEALSSKKPVLTTNKVNIYKIIKKYNAGIITNDTYTSYLNGLKKFINMTDEKYINMKNNSLKCFQENFYGEKYFNNLMKYIKQEINS